jgi:hypothetical protein
VLEIDEAIRRPHTRLQLFARDELTRVFEQHSQNPKGLLGEVDSAPRLPQFAGPQI